MKATDHLTILDTSPTDYWSHDWTQEWNSEVEEEDIDWRQEPEFLFPTYYRNEDPATIQISRLNLGDSLVIASSGDPHKIMRSLIKEFFPGLREPRLKVVNRIRANWLGVAVISVKMPGTTIMVQRSILNDEKTLERVLAHELIHAYQYENDPWYTEFRNEKDGRERLQMKRYKTDAHSDPIFSKFQSKINASRGKDFVTESSSHDYKMEQTKEFYVVIELYNNKLGYNSFSKLTPKIKQILENKITMHSAKVFRTKDTDLLAPSSLSYGSYVPKDAEKTKKLETLYKSGKEVRLNLD